MITGVNNLTRLDWGTWVRGVVGALISGGAGAVASGVSASMADPGHDLNVFKVAGFTFLISGVISLAKFLQITPTPMPAGTVMSVPAPPNTPTQPTTKPS